MSLIKAGNSFSKSTDTDNVGADLSWPSISFSSRLISVPLLLLNGDFCLNNNFLTTVHFFTSTTRLTRRLEAIFVKRNLWFTVETCSVFCHSWLWCPCYTLCEKRIGCPMNIRCTLFTEQQERWLYILKCSQKWHDIFAKFRYKLVF